MKPAEELLRFLQKNLQLPYDPVIAGGFARDMILGQEPRDIDVFLLCPETGVGEVTSEVASRLKDHHLIYTVEFRSNYNGVRSFGAPVNFQFLRWPVQIIPTPCRDPEDVLLTFDYDICRFRYDGYNEGGTGKAVPLYESDLLALINRQMALQHTRTPWSSLRRGILMADRFGFYFNEADRKSLIAALAAEYTRHEIDDAE